VKGEVRGREGNGRGRPSGFAPPPPGKFPSYATDIVAYQDEIQRVLDVKVAPSRIIYANPCKQTSFIQFAAKQNVNLMTFDDETELYKIKANFSEAK